MKKIMYVGALVLSCHAVLFSQAQAPAFSVHAEKKELRQEKKQISQEEKGIRREDRLTRHGEVSYMTREQFKRDFPGATNPSYYAGQRFSEVFFNQDGQEFTAYYDAESNLVGTTTPKLYEELPQKAREDINRHYLDKGYSLSRVILYDDNESIDSGMWLYGHLFDDNDAYFVELQKAGQTTVLQVDMNGEVSFFNKM